MPWNRYVSIEKLKTTHIVMLVTINIPNNIVTDTVAIWYFFLIYICYTNPFPYIYITYIRCLLVVFTVLTPTPPTMTHTHKHINDISPRVISVSLDPTMASDVIKCACPTGESITIRLVLKMIFHIYITSSYWTWLFCRGVSGFATDCPCDVWCRGLTTCLLHVGPPFGNRFLNTSLAVGLTYWTSYFYLIFVFWHMQLYMSWYIISFFWLYLYFLNILFFQVLLY